MKRKSHPFVETKGWLSILTWVALATRRIGKNAFAVKHFSGVENAITFAPEVGDWLNTNVAVGLVGPDVVATIATLQSNFYITATGGDEKFFAVAMRHEEWFVDFEVVDAPPLVLVEQRERATVRSEIGVKTDRTWHTIVFYQLHLDGNAVVKLEMAFLCENLLLFGRDPDIVSPRMVKDKPSRNFAIFIHLRERLGEASVSSRNLALSINPTVADEAVLRKLYPCVGAVSRCSAEVWHTDWGATSEFQFVTKLKLGFRKQDVGPVFALHWLMVPLDSIVQAM